MSDIVVDLTGEALKQILFPIIHKGYEKFKNLISENETERAFDQNYIKYCEDIFYVRTLSSRQSHKFIDDFYVPLLLKGINTYSLEVGDNTQLNTDNRGILIKGFAGQGKSTILRKLILNNFKNNKIPIFFELKNYDGSSLENSIIRDFNKIGIPVTNNFLRKLLNNNDVVLYLDAFDESLPTYRTHLISEMRNYINAYNANIVITSRPDDDLNSLPHLDEYHVSFLDENKIREIIRKEAQDKDKAEDLINNLNNDIFQIDEDSVFKTPILVSLYTISYNLGEEVPTNLSSFYDKIFDAVFYIHDNLKGRINRERTFNDNRLIYINIFSFISLMIIQEDYANLKYNSYLEKVKSSLIFLQEDTSKYQNVAEDIINISNLIIKDGYNEIKFIHKSIAEFFAAKFISKMMPKNKVDDFYKCCLGNVYFNKNFLNVLKFLEEIDSHDYFDKYYLKGVSGVLELNFNPIDVSSYDLSKSLVNLFLKTTYIRVTVNYSHGMKGTRVEEFFLNKPEILYNIQSEYQYFYHNLFERAYQKMSLDREEFKFCRKLARIGIYEDDNRTCRLTMGGCVENLGITLGQVENSLRLSIVEIFMNKYNRSLSKMNHIEKFVSSSNIFNF